MFNLSERSCMRIIDFASLYHFLLLDSGTVPIEWYVFLFSILLIKLALLSSP